MTSASDASDASDARPGLAPPKPSAISTQVVEVDGEQFLLSEYSQSGDLHDYGYEWLTGPNEGYGFGSFGPAMALAEHETSIHHFLADIDPDTGYLSERDPRGEVLSDDQILLRPWTGEDAEFLVEASADPAIRQYNGDHDRDGRPAPSPSTAQALATIDGFKQHRDAFATSGAPGGVVFLIEDAGTGEPVGCCGVDGWTGEDVAQIGYWLVPAGRGRGYATRAVVLLTRWLFDLGAARVFLTVVAGNERSAAVARRAGYVYEGKMRSHAVWQGQRSDVLWFAALPSEWPSRSPHP